MKRIFTLPFVVFLFCCNGIFAQSCGPNAYNWADMVAIFTSNGCTNCHGQASQGGLNLTNYLNTVNGGTLGMGGCGTYPTALEFLVGKVDGTLSQLAGCGNPMPPPTPFGTPGMQQADLTALKTWIAAGAPEFCQVQNPCLTPNQNICQIILANPMDPLATLDCDMGGIINRIECQVGTDPLEPSDDCQAAIAGNIDICDLIQLNPGHPLTSLDCDMGGVINIVECNNGTNPSVKSDDLGTIDCNSIPTGQNICALINGDPNHPLATLDCDNGGIDNYTECQASTDPREPNDDCQAAIAGNVDICDLIQLNPGHPLTSQDCDMGGVINIVECNNGTNPSVASDDLGTIDCSNIPPGQTICALINGNPNHSLATLDCDNGGIDNYTECQAATDPLNSLDDCKAAIDENVDICDLIQLNPGHPLTSQDCDNGGVINITECNNGTDPSVTSDDQGPTVDCATVTPGQNICTLINGNQNHPLATLDCDNGGIDNITECLVGTDPLNATDDCQAAIGGNVDICTLIQSVPGHPLTSQDCDMGGVINITECLNGTDPSEPSDDQTVNPNNCNQIPTGTNICLLIGNNPNHPLATLDCDNGGIDNITECLVGTDPFDATDDCRAAIQANVNICALIQLTPGHPLTSLDCDMGGVINITECMNGTDPSEPSDDNIILPNCTNLPVGSNICLLINGDPTHPLASLDCDNGGVINIVECQTGTDPTDPTDDCQAAIAGGLNICSLIGGSLSHPLAQQDCDMGGVVNITECLNGTDPSVASDDNPGGTNCSNIPTTTTICALINNDPNHPLSTLDCDNGGIDNYTECQAGTDPTFTLDDCQAAITENVDICDLIQLNPGHPLTSLDCDNGGVINITECQNGTDPSVASDDVLGTNCNNIPTTTTICALINGDPSHPLANLDCDNGGIVNIIECQAGTDPNVALDDCQAAIAANVNICTLIQLNPGHPLTSLDCDNGGVINIVECQNGTDPSVASDDQPKPDDCGIINPGTNICQIIAGNPNSPLASLDCDNGGIINIIECQIGTDPFDASDDCEAAINANVDICLLIGINQAHPLATQDCDMGGVINITECINGTDPSEPSDDNAVPTCTNLPTGANICLIINGDPDHPLASLDCDNGGVINFVECQIGTDPRDADDDCVAAIAGNLNICMLINNDPNHPLASQDCDMGGVINITECNNGTDPSEPSDDNTTTVDCSNLPTGSDICALINGDPNHPLATLDCDKGGVDNYTECTNNGEPDDPADDCDVAIVANLNICTLINNDPNHPLATLDCDMGGVINSTECANGTDPSEPSDDNTTVPTCTNLPTGSDICVLINGDPSHPLASLDCDNGGVDNYTECVNNGEPEDPADDCDIAILANLNICMLINNDPNHPLATQDCDMGGVINITECTNGTDPSEPSDDQTTTNNCTNLPTGADICMLINNDPTHPLATLDCDNGGVNNYIECISGENPSDPTDDCQAAIDEDLLICALISPGGIPDPNHPLAQQDCDMGGVVNITECTNGTDPSEPSDDSSTNDDPDLTPIITILPGNISGVANVGVVVEVSELNNNPTDGSAVIVRIPLDPRLTFTWDPTLTNVGFNAVQNSQWTYSTFGGLFHQFEHNGIILGLDKLAFGFISTYDPQGTDGQTTITSTVFPFSGGETNATNNSDSERLVYFN